MDSFIFGAGILLGLVLTLPFNIAVLEIKRLLAYLARRGAEPEPPRVPETVGGRARLNAEFMDTVRELVREGVFVPGGNRAKPGDLGYVYRVEACPVGGEYRKDLTVREDGVISEESYYSLCLPDAPTLLYTQYLEKYPDGPVLMDVFQSRLEDVKALGEHREHEREVAREMWEARERRRKGATG